MLTATQLAEEDSKLPWPDDRLVKSCLKGDEEAWAALIDKYKNLIFSIPIKFGFSQEDAGEIFQTICAELLSELPKLREPKALAAWLIRIASNKCIQRKRQSERFVSSEAVVKEPVAAVQQMPDRMLLQIENEQAIRVAIYELSPRCRRLVQMLFFEQPTRPYEEIAEELGLATGSIGFIRGRCLEKLRQRLQKAGFE